MPLVTPQASDTTLPRQSRNGKPAVVARLGSIYRYPVKGFGAQPLSRAELAPGRGIPFDRCFAITNGERSLPVGEAWAPCQTFVRLTKNTDLPGYALDFDEASLTARLTGPGGETIRLTLNKVTTAPPDFPRSWSPRANDKAPSAVLRTVCGSTGYWDHEDAAISLINLATVALLEKAAGQPLDPLRFRGNLYLDRLAPGEEFALLGRRIGIGEAILEILRPIDRCRATSVDPSSGDASLNVPALLGRSLGHVYCGVYGRVVRAGRIMPGDTVEDLGPADRAPQEATLVSTAPPVQDWPRVATIAERIVESASVVSLWLDDPLAPFRPQIKAGQHLRVHLVDDAGHALWRCYTISGAEGSRLRITVKRQSSENCGMSASLHRGGLAGTRLLISGPFGNVHLKGEVREVSPIILVSAGIGITPTAAMVRELARSPGRHVGPVFIIHAASDRTDLALWHEVLDFAQYLPGVKTKLYFSREEPENCAPYGALAGRIAFDTAFKDLQEIRDANAFVCGPPGFLQDARTALLEAGLDERNIHIEAFASPRPSSASGLNDRTALPTPSGPFKVRFDADGLEAVWRPEAGTLLDLAEANGMAPSANCRSGVCGACRAGLLSGSVYHSPEPIIPVGAKAVLPLLCRAAQRCCPCVTRKL